jgi:hypothetical protein
MRNLLIHSILAAVAGLAIPPEALSQNSRPDLSGIWSRSDNSQNFSPSAPPLQAAFKATYDENRRGVALPAGGLDELDPTIYCLPHGMPRAMSSNSPFEIVQGPSQVVHVLFEQSYMQRRIYLDGRKLPENYPPTFMGFSTGRYDGDTLVVETVALNDLTWLDNSGVPHSDALRVTERMRRTGQDTMEIAFRFEDPNAFTRPWEGTKPYELKPHWGIMENTGYCEDRFRFNFGKRIFKGTVDWQSPEQAEGGQ